MRYVILDRDGVINADSPEFIKSVEVWQPLPGALEAIARLTNASVAVTIATNQSGLARGLFDIDALNLIHQALRTRAATLGGRVELIAFCPHGPADGCECRKPKAGLLREISRRLGAPLAGVPVVGDSVRDLRAAQTVGARPIMVRTGKGAGQGARLPADLRDVPVVADLPAAVDLILNSPGAA